MTVEDVCAMACDVLVEALEVRDAAVVLSDGHVIAPRKLPDGVLRAIGGAGAGPQTFEVTGADAGTLLVIPLRLGDRALGRIGVFHAGPRVFGDEETLIAEEIAAHLADSVAHRSDEAETAARARQQQALADFGRLAVSTTDIHELQNRAVNLILEVLGVEESAIWELLPDDVLRIAACVFPGGEPGVAMRIPPKSQFAYTLSTGRPTVVEDWRTETRFREEGARIGREVLSGVSVILPGLDKPYAVMAAYARRPRKYAPDEIHWMQALANIVATRMERQHAVNALADNELRYRSLVMATAQMVWVTDDTGAVVGKTENWVELTGQKPEQVVGEGWINAVHTQDRERVRQAWHKALDTQTSFQEETQIRLRDGAYRYFLVRVAPVFDPDGTLREWIGTLTDIHERRRADDAVKLLSDAGRSLSSSLDYQATIRAIAEGFVPRFADWCFIDAVSDEGVVQRLARYHSDPEKLEIAARAYEKYGAKNSEDFIRTVARVGQPIIIPQITEEMTRQTAIDEEHYNYISQIPPRSCIALPLRVRDRVFGVITFVQSDSYRRFDDHDLAFAEELGRRAATAIENAILYEQAQEANRAKDEFLATLSHELRTPMTAILGWTCFLQLGDKEIEPPTLIAALKSIERSAHAQSRMIEDLLDISRIVTGKMHLDKRHVELGPVLASAIESLRPAARAKNVNVRTSFVGGENTVLGDPVRLQQIFSNLIANAIKFTPNGGSVRVTLDFVEDHVQISVTDNGEGISADFLPHIFDRFRQADSSTTRRHGGMGLGLAIVRHLVELHEGRVEARSEGIGRGAEFIVTLPLRAAAAADVEVAEEPDGRKDRSLEGLRVLIVDDDHESRHFLETVLQHAGADVRASSGVRQALEVYQLWPPEVIVTDLAMPEIDGYEFVVRLRKQGSKVPVVAVTAHAGSDRERALASGFDRYLAKPFDPFQLVRVIGELSGRPRTDG